MRALVWFFAGASLVSLAIENWWVALPCFLLAGVFSMWDLERTN